MVIHCSMDLLMQPQKGRFDMSVEIGKSKNLTLISGPCAIESEELCLLIADHICDLIQDLPMS